MLLFPSGSFLNNSSAMLAVAACTALGEIGRNGILLIPAEGEGFTKLFIVENLLARITSGKESTKVTSCSLRVYTLWISDKSLRTIKIMKTCSYVFIIMFYCYFPSCFLDEGKIHHDLGLSACGRRRLLTPEEAAAGAHGLCGGMRDWLYWQTAGMISSTTALSQAVTLNDKTSEFPCFEFTCRPNRWSCSSQSERPSPMQP